MFSVFDFSTILQFGTFLTFCSSVTFSSLFLFRVSASVFLSVCKFSRSSTPKPPASSAFFQSSDPQFWDPWEPFSFFFFCHFFVFSLFYFWIVTAYLQHPLMSFCYLFPQLSISVHYKSFTSHHNPPGKVATNSQIPFSGSLNCALQSTYSWIERRLCWQKFSFKIPGISVVLSSLIIRIRKTNFSIMAWSGEHLNFTNVTAGSGNGKSWNVEKMN